RRVPRAGRQSLSRLPPQSVPGAAKFFSEGEQALQGVQSLTDRPPKVLVDQRDVDVALVAFDDGVHASAGLTVLHARFRIHEPAHRRISTTYSPLASGATEAHGWRSKKFSSAVFCTAPR